jgi:hypothetical protein
MENNIVYIKTDNNIIVNELTGNPIIIDFGASFIIQEKWENYESIQRGRFFESISTPNYKIETPLMGNLLKNRFMTSDELEKIIINHVQLNNEHKSLFVRLKDKDVLTEEEVLQIQNNYIEKIKNKTSEQILTECAATIESWDYYTVVVDYLLFLNEKKDELQLEEGRRNGLIEILKQYIVQLPSIMPKETLKAEIERLNQETWKTPISFL